jgi:hypothetical protein
MIGAEKTGRFMGCSIWMIFVQDRSGGQIRRNKKCGWRQGSFCFALTGLCFFGGDLPRAALADSLCPGLSYFALSGRMKEFASHPNLTALVQKLWNYCNILPPSPLATARRGRFIYHSHE